MKIAIGSDHAGFEYKEKLKLLLAGLAHSVSDFGTSSTEPVDYPLLIRPTAEAVAHGECERGIVLGGSGNGEASGLTFITSILPFRSSFVGARLGT